ncbi:MAG TPA: hypothetical protein VMG35_29355 [Bryobacteraceae bacterium]|nr:hypothetical protein [Bryobacteraceae bacterium]
MFKKIGLPVIALLGMLAMAPHQAKAAVRIGVVVGRPVYTYPVYPVCSPRPVAVVPAPVVVEHPIVRREIVRHEIRRNWARPAWR